jgi:hypothetical protein
MTLSLRSEPIARAARPAAWIVETAVIVYFPGA